MKKHLSILSALLFISIQGTPGQGHNTPAPGPAPIPVPTPVPAPGVVVGTGDGLRATYFDNPDLTGRTHSRVDPQINFNWADTSPAPAINHDTFSVRWTGFAQAERTEEYYFWVKSDDGVRLRVNGSIVIRKWENQSTKEWGGHLPLVAGQKVSINLEYFDSTGDATCELRWSSASTPKQLIPQRRLYSQVLPVLPSPTPPVVSPPAPAPQPTAVPTPVAPTPVPTTQPTPVPITAPTPLPTMRPPGGGDMDMDAERRQPDFALVTDAAATHVSVQSGSWGEAATWRGGNVPTEDARVIIAEGNDVIIDEELSFNFHTVRVDGSLRFNPNMSTRLAVDTIVVDPAGYLEIGTETNPIAVGKTARIIFTDNGALDVGRDPKLIGRGLIAHGTVMICGQTVTPFVELEPPAVGTTRLLLKSNTVAGWRAGQTLLIPGTNANANEDELVKIMAVSQNEISIDRPIRFARRLPADVRAAVHVANLSRNVVFESENKSDPARAGHVMFMHTPMVDVCHASFDHIGRTNKTQMIAGTNARGRYAFHVHMAGAQPGSMMANVTGCVATNNPGWGFVNHSSHVNFSGNVTYNILGAGFVAEVGNEIGEFAGNMAVRSIGDGSPRLSARGEDDPARVANSDFGHAGFGFWMQGLGCVVRDNVAAGHYSAGYGLMGKVIEVDKTITYDPNQFPAANLPDPSVANGAPWVNQYFIPIRFINNQAYAARAGLETWRIGDIMPDGRNMEAPNPRVERVITGLRTWNVGQGLYTNYTQNLILRNCWLAGTMSDGPTGRGEAVSGDMGDSAQPRSMMFEDTDVVGWKIGMVWGGGLFNKATGGLWNNQRDFAIGNGEQRVVISGVRFGSGSNFSDYRFGNVQDSRSNTVLFNDKQIYFPQNAPGDAKPTTPGLKLDGLLIGSQR